MEVKTEFEKEFELFKSKAYTLFLFKNKDEFVLNLKNCLKEITDLNSEKGNFLAKMLLDKGIHFSVIELIDLCSKDDELFKFLRIKKTLSVLFNLNNPQSILKAINNNKIMDRLIENNENELLLILSGFKNEGTEKHLNVYNEIISYFDFKNIKEKTIVSMIKTNKNFSFLMFIMPIVINKNIIKNIDSVLKVGEKFLKKNQWNIFVNNLVLNNALKVTSKQNKIKI